MCVCSKLLFLISVRVSLQVELTGSSVFDYIHPADHVEMAERLGIRPHLRAEAGCHTAPESASSSASTSSLAGTPEPGTSFVINWIFTSLKQSVHTKNKWTVLFYISLTFNSSIQSPFSCWRISWSWLFHPHEVHADEKRPARQVFWIQGTNVWGKILPYFENTPWLMHVFPFTCLLLGY